MKSTIRPDLIRKMDSLKNEEIQKPSIPIGIYLQEAEDLALWMEEDLELLASAGLDPSAAENLITLTGACRQAQSMWIRERRLKELAGNSWKNVREKASNLRKDMMHTLRFAFREDSFLLKKLGKISKGRANSDLVQDLTDLVILARTNQELLDAIHADPGLFKDADDFVKPLASHLGRINALRRTTPDGLDRRNRAYTLLKAAVDNIRDTGKYVFRNNPGRLCGYSSDFLRFQNAKSRNKETD